MAAAVGDAYAARDVSARLTGQHRLLTRKFVCKQLDWKKNNMKKMLAKRGVSSVGMYQVTCACANYALCHSTHSLHSVLRVQGLQHHQYPAPDAICGRTDDHVSPICPPTCVGQSHSLLMNVQICQLSRLRRTTPHLRLEFRQSRNGYPLFERTLLNILYCLQDLYRLITTSCPVSIPLVLGEFYLLVSDIHYSIYSGHTPTVLIPIVIRESGGTKSEWHYMLKYLRIHVIFRAP